MVKHEQFNNILQYIDQEIMPFYVRQLMDQDSIELFAWNV